MRLPAQRLTIVVPNPHGPSKESKDAAGRDRERGAVPVQRRTGLWYVGEYEESKALRSSMDKE
jgi:hypothetical protein